MASADGHDGPQEQRMNAGIGLKPKFDRVLIRRESLQNKNSMIQLPAEVESRTKPARGVIVALGPTVGYLDDATREIVRDLSVGMRVIFGKHAGVEVEYSGESYWLVNDRDILCEINEETPS
jgi:chaperonin GroES